MNHPENSILIIFGASGDLTKRKLIPALYSLEVQNLLPNNFFVFGASRTELSDTEFRDNMADALNEFSKDEDLSKKDQFLKRLYYQSVQANDSSSYKPLINRLEKLENEKEMKSNLIFYLSTPPSLYDVIPDDLAKVKLNDESNGWKRLIIEKPFGYDYESAKYVY